MRKFWVVLCLVALVLGCHVGETTSHIDLGTREDFTKTHSLPYDAPAENQDLCKVLVDFMVSQNPTILPDEVLDYVRAPDIVSFRFRSKEFVGMDLEYVLHMDAVSNPGDSNKDSYLSIQYDKRQGWAAAIYAERGEIVHNVPVTDIRLTETIHALEGKYKDEIDEATRLINI